MKQKYFISDMNDAMDVLKTLEIEEHPLGDDNSHFDKQQGEKTLGDDDEWMMNIIDTEDWLPEWTSIAA